MRTRVVSLLAGLLAALTAGCRVRTPPSAPPAPAESERVVRLTRSLSLTAITLAAEVRETTVGQVSGAMWVSSGEDNRQFVERTYGCRTRLEADAAGPEHWSCRVPFVGGTPDWVAVLARLDELGVMAPPPAPVRVRGAVETTCYDGAPWALVVRRGAPDSVTIGERQSCGPASARRAAFEAGVDSVWSAIDAAARVR